MILLVEGLPPINKQVIDIIHPKWTNLRLICTFKIKFCRSNGRVRFSVLANQVSSVTFRRGRRSVRLAQTTWSVLRFTKNTASCGKPKIACRVARYQVASKRKIKLSALPPRKPARSSGVDFRGLPSRKKSPCVLEGTQS